MAMKKLLTREQLKKLTTKRLIAYKRSLMKVPEGPNWDDDTWGTDTAEVPNDKWNKANPRWKEHIALVKEVLGAREHVEK